jgi:hypothetical protein
VVSKDSKSVLYLASNHMRMQREYVLLSEIPGATH